MSGLFSRLVPGWSGEIAGGFKRIEIARVLDQSPMTRNESSSVYARLDAQLASAAWTDRRDERQIAYAAKQSDPALVQQIIGRLTRRQDQASEAGVSAVLVGAGVLLALTGQPWGLLLSAAAGCNAVAAMEARIRS